MVTRGLSGIGIVEKGYNAYQYIDYNSIILWTSVQDVDIDSKDIHFNTWYRNINDAKNKTNNITNFNDIINPSR